MNKKGIIIVFLLLLLTSVVKIQGFDHGAMAQPAYKILKDHIKRITDNMSSSLP